MPISSISLLLELSGLRILRRSASPSELLLLEALRLLCFDFLFFSFLPFSVFSCIGIGKAAHVKTGAALKWWHTHEQQTRTLTCLCL